MCGSVSTASVRQAKLGRAHAAAQLPGPRPSSSSFAVRPQLSWAPAQLPPLRRWARLAAPLLRCLRRTQAACPANSTQALSPLRDSWPACVTGFWDYEASLERTTSPSALLNFTRPSAMVLPRQYSFVLTFL